MRHTYIAIAVFALFGSAHKDSFAYIDASGMTVDVLSQHEEVFIPDPLTCKADDICDLRKIIFRVRNLRAPPKDVTDIDMYTTKMYASYVTDTLPDIKKYAFVQFIRGCEFVSELLPSGEVERTFKVNRPLPLADAPDGTIRMRYPSWVIDSDRPDPIYSSDPTISRDRTFLLQWNTPPDKWDPDESQANIYGLIQPKFPQVFITDNPTPARSYLDGTARNASLELRVCLYKLADVPATVNSDHVDFAKPIKCFDWSHSYIYDHTHKTWSRPVGISAVCNRPLTIAEQQTEEALRTKIRERLNNQAQNSANAE